MNINFGSFESNAARFTTFEAWVLIDKKWRKLHPADVNNSAALLSEAKFNAEFGQVPALPKAAFQSDE